MAKGNIPTYEAKRPIEAISFGPKAYPEAMSRGQRAMARFGRTAISVGVSIGSDLLERDADIEYSTARRQGRELFNSFARELETTIDPKDYEKPYKKFLSSVKGLRPKSKRGGERFDQWYDYMEPAWNKQTGGYTQRQILKNLNTDTMINIEAAIESNDRDGAIESINNRVASRLWTEKQGQAALKVLDSQIEYYQAFSEIRRRALPLTGQGEDPIYLREAAADISGEMIIKAIDWNKYPNLTRKQEELLIRDADALAKSVKQKTAETLGLIQEKTDVDFFGQYSNGTLMPSNIADAVEQGRLDRASGDRWLDRLANPRDFATDPNIEADLLRRIEDPTQVVTQTDILDLLGKGLNATDTERFLTKIDVFKDPWFVRADRFLKEQLGWSDTYTKFVHSEGGISYHAAMNQLFTDIEVQGLKGKDIYERAIETGIPFIVSYWENVLGLQKPQIERMKTMLRGKKVTPKKKGPVGPLREQPEEGLNFDLLDPLGIWK